MERFKTVDQWMYKGVKPSLGFDVVISPWKIVDFFYGQLSLFSDLQVLKRLSFFNRRAYSWLFFLFDFHLWGILGFLWVFSLDLFVDFVPGIVKVHLDQWKVFLEVLKDSLGQLLSKSTEWIKKYSRHKRWRKKISSMFKFEISEFLKMKSMM